MDTVDIVIVAVYLSCLILLGILLRRKATQGIEAYFLGGRRIPWWVLGISGTASFLDMTGTMVVASFFYMVGVKGFLVELRGGVALILAFLMVFMGKWHSRAKVMTSAEWMTFRFGPDRQGQAARHLSTLGNVVITVAMIAYFFVGTGKFLSLFLPFSPQVCSLIMIAVCLFYTTVSGLYGVVYTDLLQSLLIAFGTLFVSIKAFLAIDADALRTLAPAGWTDILPAWHLEMPSGYEMYNLFGLSVMFFFLKVVGQGMGGEQGMVSQRYFASASDRDSGRLTALWTLCMTFRWPFIMAVAVFGLYLGDKVREPEMVLPTVLAALIPAGVKGLIISALVAAAMSTFDSTLNAGASYLVRDVYQNLIRPEASEKNLIHASYASSVFLVVLGVGVGLVTPSINAIWGWITMSLGAGLFLPLLFRWYWWRFNGYGFALGTAVGIAAAVVQKLALPHLPEWAAFLGVSAVSLTGILAATWAFPPTDPECLQKFYSLTRPRGLWSPVARSLPPEEVRSVRRENRRDLIALGFAVPWQISLFLVPVHAVIHEWVRVGIFSLVLGGSSLGLYHFWYRHLDGS